MPRAYSLDLRSRVLAASLANRWTPVAIAERFGVGESTVRLWLRQARTTGQVAPKRPVGGKPVIDDVTGAPVLRALVAERNDATLAELAAGYTARTGVRVTVAMVWRTCRRLGLKRKRKRPAPQ